MQSTHLFKRTEIEVPRSQVTCCKLVMGKMVQASSCSGAMLLSNLLPLLFPSMSSKDKLGFSCFCSFIHKFLKRVWFMIPFFLLPVGGFFLYLLLKTEETFFQMLRMRGHCSHPSSVHACEPSEK